MTQVPALLTPTQAVERLAAGGVYVTQETVRSWARTKKIPCRRLPGGHYLFRVEDIDAVLEPAA